ncbi:hypothetical protein EMPS_11466 [Entomortierella parvispora]|uniref:Uncharacterized protein n=1 Tax=Entomortierella parvispora TaxID=205924 RepID=A0A9P3HLY2_9FUNG|nr:hypothetical protein EMPS_11466 [Entomortierella parvispora]
MKTSIVAVALVLVASAQACLKTCEYSGMDGKNCLYTCKQACESIPASEAAGNFLAALQAKGYSCNFNGSTGVKCDSTKANFGACTGHYWQCGAGC